MIEYNQATIESMVVHHIGTRAEAEPNKFSKSVLSFNDDQLVEEILKPFFFRSFKADLYYNFDHEVDIEQNYIFSILLHYILD